MGAARVASGLAPIPFWYLRHGETDWNARGLAQGSIDIPLNETGIAQARSAANLLRNRGIATIVASSLSRARVTAEIIGAELGLPVALDDGLREVRFGVEEGRPQSDWFKAWLAGGFAPEGAESFAELTARATAAVNRATVRPPLVLVVAHGALFRALRAAMSLPFDVPTRNAVPMLCTPPEPGHAGWTLDMAV
jgi:probable phosphoglycerate mutase